MGAPLGSNAEETTESRDVLTCLRAASGHYTAIASRD